MNRRSLALAAASGLLLALSFPSFDLYPLAWISLVPLLIAIQGTTSKDAFLLGGIAGIVFFSITISWLANSLHQYADIPFIPAALITLLLCAYLALYPALFTAAAAHLRENRPSFFFIVAPAIWTALELARTHVLSGSPWALLGYSQYKVLPLIQIVDITGVYGISFLIVMVNAALAIFITNRLRWSGIIGAALLLSLVLVYGFARLAAPEGSEAITISVVQGNIEQDKKWDPAYQSRTVDAYKKLSREALKQHPALVIWPETATPFYFTGPGPADRALSAGIVEFVKLNKTPLLFGSPTLQRKSEGTVLLRNSAFLLSAEGEMLDRYDKLHLVPFGEYAPFSGLLFSVNKTALFSADFVPGKDYAVMTMPRGNTLQSVKFCTVICYEIIFPDLVRTFVERGAGAIATITNDAWFGRSAAPYQHFSIAVFRAIENRVPVVRAANTGISGFIDGKGHILAASDLFTETHLTADLVPGSTKSFYTRHGDLFAGACVLFTVVVLLIGQPRSIRGQRSLSL